MNQAVATNARAAQDYCGSTQRLPNEKEYHNIEAPQGTD